MTFFCIFSNFLWQSFPWWPLFCFVFWNRNECLKQTYKIILCLIKNLPWPNILKYLSAQFVNLLLIISSFLFDNGRVMYGFGNIFALFTIKTFTLRASKQLDPDRPVVTLRYLVGSVTSPWVRMSVSRSVGWLVCRNFLK